MGRHELVEAQTRDAPAGTITSAWKKTDAGIEYTVELPDGITGELVLPDGTRRPLVAGSPTVVNS